MVGSARLEIGRGVRKAKAGLTVFRTERNAGAKAGFSELRYPLGGGPS